MIKRLEWIRDCGIFQDYQWDSDLPDLARINVIYGGNGAGKSSLARALDGTRNVPDGFGRVSLTIQDTNGTRTTEGNDDGLYERIHVFSSSFVERSHSFNTDTVDMSAVLTLGERSVESDRRLEALRPIIDAKTAEHTAATERAEEFGRQLNREYERVADSVVSAASRAGNRYRARGTYRTDVVERAYAGSHEGWRLLSESDLEAKRSLVQSDNRTELPEVDLQVIPPEGVAERISHALQATPETLILDTLEAHPQASAWVQEGQHLHEGTGTCIFCGSPLSKERIALIERHFSGSVSRLQAELRHIIELLDGLDRQTVTALAGIQNSALVFNDLRRTYDEAAETLRSQAARLNHWTGVLRGRAQAKLENVLQGDFTLVPAPPSIDGNELAAVLNQHNDRVRQHAALVQTAARELELHFLKAAEQRVVELITSQADAKASAELLADQLAQLNAELAELEYVDGDPTPSASVLNREVSRLLGHRELRFEAADGRYRVTRNGRPAVGLSMGERTAITLIHFMESVARAGPACGGSIVVIDDPVSSLDSNIFMGVSTYIWSECVAKDHVAQVILLTHSFELFRQWDIQIAGLPGHGSRNSGFPAQLYDLRSSHRLTEAGMRRIPVLAPWPPSPPARKKVRSSYHHAFFALGQAKRLLDADDSLENRLDAQLLFPNVIRRLLESFLAFKRPDWVGDFTKAMRSSAELLRQAGYTGDADALRLRLTRYAHAYSHSETPATDQTVNPDEVRTAISAVFTFMKHLDNSHFAGLCEVLDIDGTSLVEPADPLP